MVFTYRRIHDAVKLLNQTNKLNTLLLFHSIYTVSLSHLGKNRPFKRTQ